jgi:glycosyltransferase involved in cell wall biosynthesis
MRACMVAYTFYEPDNRVRRYAETLVREGWTVDAWVLRGPGQERKATINGVHVYRIQRRTIDEHGKLSYLFKLLAFLVRSGLALTVRHLQLPYTIIHVHSVPDFEVFAAIVPKLMGARVILDIHDIVPELFLSKFGGTHASPLFGLLLLMEQASMAFADHVIVANHVWGERLVKRSVPRRKCTVIMNYPDTRLFHPREKTRTNGVFRLIYPGTLSIHQGLETAIRAVAMARQSVPHLQFLIYGKGTDQAFFENLVKDLNLEGVVAFKGLLPLEQIADAMAEADVGLEPKLKNSFANEAFSTKILEFMLLEVPVIVSDTLTHLHYFDNSLVQFFTSENVAELADCIVRLSRDPLLRQRMVESASRYVQGMTWDANKRLYLDLVAGLAAPRQRAHSLTLTRQEIRS